MSTPTRRILGVIRLSAMDDDTTSPERQRESIEHYASGFATGGTIVGWAEDLDVSGGLHPMRRPSLGPWLTERAHEFDALVVWKLDRLTRRSVHFGEMHAWSVENNKSIFSITEGIDMSTPMGKMFSAMISVFNEGDLDSMTARTIAGIQTRKEKGVWIAGTPPLGYTTQKQAEGGKKLIQDGPRAELLRWMAEKIMEDWSANEIAIELQRRGELTWRDHARRQAKRETKNIKWKPQSVISALTNPAVAGYYSYKGEILEDEDGTPRMITDEPIMTAAEWLIIQQKIASRRTGDCRSAPSRSILAGIAVCGDCGAGMISSKTKGRTARAGEEGKVYFYYQCSEAKLGTCKEKTLIDRDTLDTIVNDAIRGALGNFPVYEKNRINTSEKRAQFDQSTNRLAKLENDFLSGRYDGEGQEESYWRMHRNLSGRITRLAREVEEAESAPTLINTGRTYGEVWEEKDGSQKRIFLKKHKARVTVFKGVVDHSDETVIVEVGRLDEITGIQDDGLEHYRVDYQVPLDHQGEPVTVEELRRIAAERREVKSRAKLGSVPDRELADHWKALKNQRARERRSAYTRRDAAMATRPVFSPGGTAPAASVSGRPPRPT